MTVRELFRKCENVSYFRVKITLSLFSHVVFDAEPGEPIDEYLMDNEIEKWYLPDRDDDVENLVEIYI